MEKILNYIKVIENEDEGFVTIRMFSDGSGTMYSDEDELFHWDNLEEFFINAKQYISGI